ncbi:DUF1653 domain-containing protein [Candidatus Berkiella aquae]|uniref:DUF1653 domain-containing protein n=1 Tax=Candidatus Berkiella aquae TaxID=295108 RepID=A0A0Q9YDT3_9GAMM|nr:DUF1653 domain-containing protein [Candidatus Berkiella aquae]MCS5709924.1 DUF1653 domain-containing protein [Candidatus Berkiella aquae]
MQKVIPGKYRHYKNKFYRVIGTGWHTDTLEELVIYQSLYDCEQFGHQALWTRPIADFLGTIQIDGIEMPRFTFIAE